MRRDTNVEPPFIPSPRPRPAKNISAMAKQITLKAPGNRQSLQSMSSGGPVGHRTFWPLTQTIGQGFGEGGHRDLARSPRSCNALSLVYFSRQLMTSADDLAAGPFVQWPASGNCRLVLLASPATPPAPDVRARPPMADWGPWRRPRALDDELGTIAREDFFFGRLPLTVLDLFSFPGPLRNHLLMLERDGRSGLR